MHTRKEPCRLCSLPFLSIALRRDPLQRLKYVVYNARVRKSAVSEIAHGSYRLLQRFREGLLFFLQALYLRLEVLDCAI